MSLSYPFPFPYLSEKESTLKRKNLLLGSKISLMSVLTLRVRGGWGVGRVLVVDAKTSFRESHPLQMYPFSLEYRPLNHFVNKVNEGLAHSAKPTYKVFQIRELTMIKC